MDTGILDVAAYSRAAMRLDIHELMNPGLRKPIPRCDLTFPHKCSLAGGEMSGSWEAQAAFERPASRATAGAAVSSGGSFGEQAK
jgi:hypothetical protein